MNHLLTISLILVVSGAFGGAVNALNEGRRKLSEVFIGSLSGIAAAMLVPLLLNMISSDLLTNAREDQNSYFVFAGFCLIAALTSKRFISGMSDRILSQVEETKRELKEVKKSTTPIIDRFSEPEDSNEKPKLSLNLTDPQYRILSALKSEKYSRRTLNGLCVDSGFSRPTVAGNLSELMKKGFVTNSGSNRYRYYHITTEGRRVEIPSEFQNGKSEKQ